ncbi:hypothetical protein LRD18_07375 [Halorhodospira halochloris]|uniref:hypothetical protein n=1 Tax=Halorhodospira halochloris TaxID=1052 RepID=UPI001EE83524|nr:hypothetical protein [Halorhodospira halochloris]MCG5530695.1 hypothetical protein [Halorhodospira halochloris]
MITSGRQLRSHKSKARVIFAVLCLVTLVACGDQDDDDNGNGNGNGNDNGDPQPTLTDFTAHSGEREVELRFPGADPGDSVKIYWSTDPDCDWANVFVCDNGGGSSKDISDENGNNSGSGSSAGGFAASDNDYKSITLSAAEDGLTADESHYFVVYDGDGFSEKRSARPYVLRLDGVVHELLHYEPEDNGDDESYLIAGGFFSEFNVLTGGGIAVSEADNDEAGEPVGGMPRITGRTGTIHDVVPNGNGGWYIAGDFLRVGGEKRNFVAEIDEHGVPTDWQVRVNGPVFALYVEDDSIYLGGRFSEIGGEDRYSSLAEVDRENGEVRDWQPELKDPREAEDKAEVYSIAVHEGNVFVGGDFRFVAGPDDSESSTRTGIAAFNKDSGSLRVWDPLLEGNRVVHAVMPIPEGLLVGGNFSGVEGGEADNSNSRLVLLKHPQDLDNDDKDSGVGPVDKVSHPSVDNGVVKALSRSEVNGERFLFIGGSFTEVEHDNNDNPQKVAALKIGEENDEGHKSFDLVKEWSTPDVDGSVRALSAHGDFLYIGGDFKRVGESYRGGAAALNLADGGDKGSLVEQWHPATDNAVNAIAIQEDNGTVYVGGNFSRAGAGERRQNLAAFNAHTGQLMDWAPDPDGAVFALIEHNDNIYVGGKFKDPGEGGADYLAKITDLCFEDGCNDNNNNNTKKHIGWENGGEKGAVRDMLVIGDDNGGKIYIGGHFDGIGVLDAGNGNENVKVSDKTIGMISALASFKLDNGTDYLVVGGGFNVYDSSTRKATNLAIFEANSDLEFKSGAFANGIVRALAIDDDHIFVGGEFFEIGPEAGGLIDSNLIAAIDRNDAQTFDNVKDWWGGQESGLSGTGNVETLQTSDDVLFVGGRFFNAFGGGSNKVPRDRLAAFRATDGELLGWSPDSDGQVDVMLLASKASKDGHDVLFLGGDFDKLDDELRNRISAIEIEDAETGLYEIKW